MLIDTHCHLDFPDYAPTAALPINTVLSHMKANAVAHAICISVNMEDYPQVLSLVEAHPQFYGTVGVHPCYEAAREPSLEELVGLAQHPKILAIGECGLDFMEHPTRPNWQFQRFRRHIRAAIAAQKPLVVHNRESGPELLQVMQQEGADKVGGVLHCFTDTWEIAQGALDMGFYISFSGIVTFKKAMALKEIAAKVPADRFVIETDSPYLAPEPFRGKTNHPALVRHIAEHLAILRKTTFEQIAQQSTDNAKRLFKF